MTHVSSVKLIKQHIYIMNIKTLTKLALAGLFFAGAIFTTGCEKSPEDKAADAVEDAADAMKDAVK